MSVVALEQAEPLIFVTTCVNMFPALVLQIETAVKLLLPGELGKHALSEGRKAVLSGLS